MKKLMMAAMIAAGFVSSGIAQAADGPLMIRGRVLYMEPDNRNTNSTLTALDPTLTVAAEEKIFPEVDFTYFITKNIAAELILTYPQKHEVTLQGKVIGSVKHLPPTLTLQYHLNPEGSVRPYVGAGINYTRFMNVKLDAAQFTGTADKIDLNRSSFGWAAQLGMDLKASENWFLNMDVKYVKIKAKNVRVTEGTLAGQHTDVHIDPLLMSIGLGYRF